MATLYRRRGAVRRGLARAREVYRVFGSPEGIQSDIFEGRHRIHGARACDFLAEQLV